MKYSESKVWRGFMDAIRSAMNSAPSKRVENATRIIEKWLPDASPAKQERITNTVLRLAAWIAVEQNAKEEEAND